MSNLTVSCHCCGRQYPVRWSWYVCDGCGYRVCASCLGNHRGPYNPNGGTKCSQCISGRLRSVRVDLEDRMGLRYRWRNFGDEKGNESENELDLDNYLKLTVPVKWEADWFVSLRAAIDNECGKDHVKWQRNHHHITVAFFKGSRNIYELQKSFDRILHSTAAPELTFDKVTAFETRDGKEIIVCLTAPHPSADFSALVDSLREAAVKTGAKMEPNFLPHVTLGRIVADEAVIEDVAEVAESINVQPFTLSLTEAEYRYCPSLSIRNWQLPLKTDYRAINKLVMKDTQLQYKTVPELGDAVHLSIIRQYMVNQEDDVDSPAVAESHTQYITSPRRTFEAAKGYRGKKVAVLNFANNHSVGGAPFQAGAQEESLCRCSTLYPCLKAMEEPFYKKHMDDYGRRKIDAMGNDDLIYTPDVVVFKTDERSDPVFPRMMDRDDWYKVDVITCAAPELRHATHYPDNYEAIITRRIKRILDVAAKEKVEVLILGAWGCGAFRNDIAVVSRTFYTLLKNYDFETVEFALGATKYFGYFTKGTRVE